MLLDILLCLIGTVFAVQSINKILKNTSNSLGDYVVIIVYIFNCLPILLNLIFGLPDYKMLRWFSAFYEASKNEIVRNIYAIYTLLVILMIKKYLYDNRCKKQLRKIYIRSKSRLLVGRRLLYISFTPVICAIIFGNYGNYLIFQSAIKRGLTSSQYSILVMAEYIGLFSFFCWFFEYRESKKMHSYIWLFLYSFLIMWIDGKRYLIPTIIVLFIFYYTHSLYFVYKKVSLRLLMFVITISFVLLYVLYAVAYKIDQSTSVQLIEKLYLSFRIDFGRDDVTKFVLYKELIENNPILEYRGESILSTFLFFIPRSIWQNKPYPHYRYLTAALYNTDVLSIPAGMTPSIFEMSIANFGVIFGIIFTSLFFPIVLKKADREKSIVLKALYLVLLIGILTQSLDAMISVIFMAIMNKFFQKVTFLGKKII